VAGGRVAICGPGARWRSGSGLMAIRADARPHARRRQRPRPYPGARRDRSGVCPVPLVRPRASRSLTGPCRRESTGSAAAVPRPRPPVRCEPSGATRMTEPLTGRERAKSRRHDRREGWFIMVCWKASRRWARYQRSVEARSCTRAVRFRRR
jgi:hypothetical protein